METDKLNLGMNGLITRERERLGIRIVSDYEICKDEFTVLPGYEGYEHFTVERGYGLLASNNDNFQLLSNGVEEFYPTMEDREKVFEAGYEFLSIIKLAALSIGNAAVYGKESFSDLTDFFPPQETDMFWLHVIQAWILMGTATDKLRSFYIQFVLSQSENAIDKKLKGILKKEEIKPKQFIYIQAFHEPLGNASLSVTRSKNLEKLHSLLNNIGDIRLKRNKYVHEYSSREAMIIAARRDNDSDHAEAFKAFIGAKKADSYITELADAYKILVAAGNLVFLLEKDVTESSEKL